jgi:hypothetical protein
MIHGSVEYTVITLLLVGIATLVCMGMSRVFYIGIAYTNRYWDAIYRPLLCAASRLFTTLRLCVARSNGIYEKPIDPLLTMNRTEQVMEINR